MISADLRNVVRERGLMRPKIVIVGSSNTDMVVRAEHLPLRGETVLGEKFIMTAGGKGANQAVAAARLGAEVTFVARLGRDMFGDQALAGYQAEGIHTDYIVRDDDEDVGRRIDRGRSQSREYHHRSAGIEWALICR